MSEPITLSLDDGSLDVYVGPDEQVVLDLGDVREDVWLTAVEAQELQERLERVLDELPLRPPPTRGQRVLGVPS